MDRNTKIATGAFGCLWTFGMWKMFRLHERVELLEKCVALIHQIMEVDFQKEIDEKFEEIEDPFPDE